MGVKHNKLNILTDNTDIAPGSAAALETLRINAAGDAVEGYIPSVVPVPFEPGSGANSAQLKNGGSTSNASGIAAVAEGNTTTASGNQSHSEGTATQASGDNSHAEGNLSIANNQQAHAEGWQTTASGADSHAEGHLTIASGNRSHAEGWTTTASGVAAHAEGQTSVASGIAAHAEGNANTASGNYSHAENHDNTASGVAAHAEGNQTKAEGTASHAEGIATSPTNAKASGFASHSEGAGTEASGYGSHSQNRETLASGANTHAGGYRTRALGENAFNHSRNDLGVLKGAEAANSAILGGIDNHIPATGTNSVVLGGSTRTEVDPDTVSVPNVRIIPTTGGLGAGRVLTDVAGDGKGTWQASAGGGETLAQTLVLGRNVDNIGTILTDTGDPSIDVKNRTLRSTDGFVTETIINWFDQKIFSIDSAANGPVIDWALCLLNETIAGNINPSLDWTQRRTYDGNGNLPNNTSFNWASRRLFDSINGDTGSDLGTAINWGDRQAYGQDGVLSIGWDASSFSGRRLFDDNGNESLAWSVSSNSDYFVQSRLPSVAIGDAETLPNTITMYKIEDGGASGTGTIFFKFMDNDTNTYKTVSLPYS